MFLIIKEYVRMQQHRREHKDSFSHIKTFTDSQEGCFRYVFVIIKNHADDTLQTNYQRY